MGRIVLLIIIFVLYQFGKSDNKTTSTNNKTASIDDKVKTSTNNIDYSKSLFDRNTAIISNYVNQVCGDTSSYYRSYYIDNLVRDCINDICDAEGKSNIKPGHSYLYQWKNRASEEWRELANQIEDYLKEIKKEFEDTEEKAEKQKEKLLSLISDKEIFKKYKEINKLENGNREIFLLDIDLILNPNTNTWNIIERDLINKKYVPKKFPEFKSKVITKNTKSLNEDIRKYNSTLEKENKLHDDNGNYFSEIYEGYKKKSKNMVEQRADYIMNDIQFPSSIPKTWEVDFDEEQGILVIEIKLPDVVHSQIYKKVNLKSKTVDKELTKKEFKDEAPKIHPAILLRIAYETFRNDTDNIINLLVLNGWVEYHSPSTGNLVRTYTSSLVVNREQILELKLDTLDPVSAFQNLKGKSSGNLIDIIPITPTLTLDKNDKRFIETKEVIDNIDNETNLASMDWQDFENLIAELFEKEFAEKGAEIKVTQSSRDRGVDAIAFDPDPIKGGKFVIQAKRYTRTVDVSAVRDLCAVVKKEGASRGILVTTSNFGPDAHAFANNEPITLLNGSELLGLLEKHGYKFRINIQEARKILKSKQ